MNVRRAWALLAFLLPATAAAVAWQDPVPIAQGPAIKGPWRQNDSRYDYVDDPTVVLPPAGAPVVAWVDQGRKDVLARHAPDAIVNVSRNPDTFSWLPRLALAPGEPKVVYALWQEIIFSGGSHGGDILFARSADGGATFSLPLNLSRSRAGDGKGRINAEIWHNGSLALQAGPEGAAYAAWTSYEGELWVARSVDQGRSFLAPQLVAGRTGEPPARAPSLAVAPGGAVYLAWTVGEDPGADLRIAASRDRGASFGPPHVVSPDETYSDAPKIAVDAEGTLHLAWHETAGGPFARSHVRYARSRDGGRSLEGERALSAEGGGFPSLAVEGARVYVAWERFPDPRARPYGLELALSRDGGASFTAPALVPGSSGPPGCLNANLQGRLTSKLAAAGPRLAVVNACFEEGGGSRVWLIRGELAPG